MNPFRAITNYGGRHKVSRGLALAFIFTGVGAILVAMFVAVLWLRVFPYRPTTAIVTVAPTQGEKDWNKAAFKYQYEVANVTYESSVWGPFEEIGGERWNAERMLTLQPGQKLTVFYNPATPSKSVVTGRPSVLDALLIAGMVFVGLLCFLRYGPSVRNTAKADA